jgi:hypothetical protein
MGDTIEHIPEAYQPAIIDGVVFYAESVDNEHANSGRAENAYTRMVQALGLNQQQRVVTDTESSGVG